MRLNKEQRNILLAMSDRASTLSLYFRDAAQLGEKGHDITVRTLDLSFSVLKKLVDQAKELIACL